MTEADALRVGLRLVAALAVIVGTCFAFIGAATTWTILRMRRDRQGARAGVLREGAAVPVRRSTIHKLEAPHGKENDQGDASTI